MRRLVLATLLLVPALGRAACPDACETLGGGQAKADCLVGFDGVGATKVRCTDGDPSCDTDGSVNGSCRFALAPCLDVASTRCAPGEITSFEVKNGKTGSKQFDAQLAALEASVVDGLPTSVASCRAPVPVYVALKGKKRFKKTTLKVKTTARAADRRKDADAFALTCVPSSRFTRPAEGYAVAKVVTAAAELIEGPLARGKAGDLLLANDRIQVVVQQPGRSMFGIGTYGGNIIDADRQRLRGEERDNFEELIPQINVENTANYTSVSVFSDGSDGGAAIVRATGPDDLFDFVNASSVVEMAGFAFPAALDDRDLPIDVQTDYVLEPGADWVRMETTLTNLGAAPIDTFAGDYLNGSGQVELFQPGYGFGEPLVTTPCPEARRVPCAGGTCDTCNIVAYAGEGAAAGVSYGYVQPVPGSTTFSVSGVTASLMGNEVLLVIIGLAQPNVHLAPAGSPGDAVTITRYFVVGDGSVASIADARNAIQGITTGTVTGAVTSGGQPVADADVVVLAEPFPGGPSLNAVDHFRTDASGRYRGTVPAGAYTLRANREGRRFAAPESAAVTVGAGAEVTQDFTLEAPALLEVTVTDEADQPVPAKVQVVGFDPSPEPTATQDIAGAVFNRTGIFGTVEDGLPFGIAGVWFADKHGRIGSVEMEPGTYRVYVSRGSRWSLSETDVTMTPGQTTTVQAQIAQVVDTPGFVAGDFHVHSIDSPDSEVTRVDRVATQLAEGIDFFTPSEHDIRVDFQPTVQAMGVEHLIATAPSAEITTFDYGHFNSWPVTVDPTQVNGGSVDWGRPGVAPGMDFPALGSFGFTPAEIYGAARADPRPNLVQINHVDSFFNVTGLDIDTAENDTGPPASHAAAASRRLDPAITNFWDPGFDTMEVWNGSQAIFLGENFGDWVNLLNQGILRSGVANSDTHERRTNGGAVRTWLASDVAEPIALPAAADALAASVVAGPAVGTNSVFFTTVVGAESTGQTAGHAVGQPTLIATTDAAVAVTVDVRAPLWAEFDTVELYVNAPTERWDHDGNPATRPRYRVTPTHVRSAGADFTVTTVDDVPAVLGAGHREATVTVPLAGLTEDVWIMVLVRGTPGVSEPLFPVLPYRLDASSNETLADLVDGNLGEGGEPVLAFSNPLYVDVDGNGWSAPGVRLTPP